MTPETIKWGLSSVAVSLLCLGEGALTDDRQRTIKFINDEGTSIHGNIKVGSVYTSEAGEWKLGGFEVLSSVKDDEAVIYVR